MRMSMFFVVPIMIVTTSIVWSEEDKTLETKSQQRKSAATIDFGASLEVPFDSLSTLGVRIEQSRKAADPVGLAAAATELAAAEKAAGKSAAIKSDELKKEALELAKLRDDAAELTAVQALLGDDLAKEIKVAAKRQKDAVAAAKDNEAARGIFHELVVDNGSEVHVHIYVNGRYVGHLDPYGHGHFHVHTHHETVLDARGPGHSWHEHVHEDYSTYHWRLND